MDVGVTSKSKEFQVIPTLLDSGANTTFIDKAVAEQLGLTLEALANPIHVFNVDGSRNSAGDITHTVNITVDFLGHQEELHAKVTNLGKNSLILGYMWLRKHNPTIDWEKGVMVMGPPTPFSPFSPTDCMLYSHFSFDNFVMIAFLDLTRDLDT